MIKLLIVDDSATVRTALRRVFRDVEGIEVVGDACDPYVARNRIFELRPDVVILDIEMPRMDGLTFLSKLMSHHPIPVVILSSAARKGSETAVRALALGAVEVHEKPGSDRSVPEAAATLIRAVRHAARTRPKKIDPSAIEAEAAGPSPLLKTTQRLIAIGASTGGAQALETVFSKMPPDAPATLVVQHMPPGFTESLAQRLNDLSAMNVREATDGETLSQGTALIAPGDRHLYLLRSGARYLVGVRKGPRVNLHRPSVDVTFRSVAQAAGSDAAGVILTGMGKDGAEGLLAMRQAGARTFAQDEESSVVYGMPREAMAIGAAEKAIALYRVPQVLIEASCGSGVAGGA